MTAAPTDQLVSIGAAVELLQTQFPDVTHSSLRFLEREGFVHSTRTAGGHRLYTPADIERITLIKRWQRQGSSLEEVRDLLRIRDSLRDVDRLSQEFLDLGLNSRLEDAARLILQADRAGLPPSTLFFEVLQPALIQLGDLWERGVASVHQEKEISVLSRELVTEITLHHAPDFPDGALYISACVMGEKHELGLCMVNGLLRQRGHRVRYLGQDVATEFLVDAVASNRPDSILLTATMEENTAGCFEAIDAIRSLPGVHSVPILVGGEVARTHTAEIVSRGATPIPHSEMAEYLQKVSPNPPSMNGSKPA